MPDLVGELVNAGRDFAWEHDLAMIEIGEVHEDVLRGRITGQSPAPHTMLAADDIIELRVSLGVVGRPLPTDVRVDAGAASRPLRVTVVPVASPETPTPATTPSRTPRVQQEESHKPLRRSPTPTEQRATLTATPTAVSSTPTVTPTPTATAPPAAPPTSAPQPTSAPPEPTEPPQATSAPPTPLPPPSPVAPDPTRPPPP
jgi:hypothetical protein